MTRSLTNLATQSLMALVFGLFLLTLAPVAITSLKSADSIDAVQADPARKGGVSVVHKNGATPLWMTRLMTRADDASIVRAIISLAHSLRLKVVAEGVETPEQLRSLKSMGCDQYQGFHFSPPLTASDLADLLRSGLSQEERMELGCRS